MENQHKKITGYRDLTLDEINLMNEIKALGERCEAMVRRLKTQTYPNTVNARGNALADQRWVSIGETHLQQGMMALVRSVAKSTSF